MVQSWKHLKNLLLIGIIQLIGGTSSLAGRMDIIYLKIMERDTLGNSSLYGSTGME